jgi:hypothetical protein
MSKTTFPTSIAHLTPLRLIHRRVQSLSKTAPVSAPNPSLAGLTRLPIPTSARPLGARRGTLRDLYTAGLVSVFRRDSVLRVWEPLRETPRHSEHDSAR